MSNGGSMHKGDPKILGHWGPGPYIAGTVEPCRSSTLRWVTHQILLLCIKMAWAWITGRTETWAHRDYVPSGRGAADPKESYGILDVPRCAKFCWSQSNGTGIGKGVKKFSVPGCPFSAYGMLKINRLPT